MSNKNASTRVVSMYEPLVGRARKPAGGVMAVCIARALGKSESDLYRFVVHCIRCVLRDGSPSPGVMQLLVCMASAVAGPRISYPTRDPEKVARWEELFHYLAVGVKEVDIDIEPMLFSIDEIKPHREIVVRNCQRIEHDDSVRGMTDISRGRILAILKVGGIEIDDNAFVESLLRRVDPRDAALRGTARARSLRQREKRERQRERREHASRGATP